MPLLNTSPQPSDKRVLFNQDERTAELMALVTQWFLDRLEVKPSGSVSLRRALSLYWLHLQSLDKQQPESIAGYPAGDCTPLHKGELNALRWAASGHPRSDAPPDTDSFTARMYRLKFRNEGLDGPALHAQVLDALLTQRKEPLCP